MVPVSRHARHRRAHSAIGGLVLGLSLVCSVSLPAEQKGQASQTKDYAEQANTQPKPPVPLGASKAPDAKVDGRGCKSGGEDGHNELCIEWRAARAAEKQVIWAERAFWLGVGGTVFVIVTLIATAWAAYAAWLAAKVAQRAVADLERPHLFVIVNPTLCVKSIGGHEQAGALFSFANYGRFPATIEACYCFLGECDEVPPRGELAEQISTFIGPNKTVEGKREWLPDDYPVRFETGPSGEPEGATIYAEAEIVTFFRIDVIYGGLGKEKYYSRFVWRWDCGSQMWVSTKSHRT